VAVAVPEVPGTALAAQGGVNIVQAFFAGVIGAAVAIVVGAASRAAGIDIGLEGFLGEPGAVGLGVLLGLGGVVALAYGLGFELLGDHVDVRWLAVGFGVVHTAVALHLFATVGALRAAVWAGGPTYQLPAAAALTAAHLAFAVVTGILYRVVVTEDQATAADLGSDLAPARVPVGRRDRAA
jgi:hypothetical protein